MHVAKIQKVLGIWKPRIGVGWRLVSCVNLEESFLSKITELRLSDPPLANLNIPQTPLPPFPLDPHKCGFSVIIPEWFWVGKEWDMGF